MVGIQKGDCVPQHKVSALCVYVVMELRSSKSRLAYCSTRLKTNATPELGNVTCHLGNIF